jgi:hypothetical protein
MRSLFGIGCATASSIALFTALGAAPAQAYELGWPGAEQKPGITLGGGSAGTPPPGIYMFDQFATTQASLLGPNAPNGPKAESAVAASGFLFVPGWNFLGASYDAVIVMPFFMSSVGAPVNSQSAGMHNTFLAPVELSWKLGDSGFFVKTGLGMYVPDGTISGPSGLGNAGDPWWTFQPEFIVSYLKDGWNLTANFFQEFHTKNPITDYQTGDIFHAEFVATKTIGKWTVGPVGYYVGQVSNDTSSAYYHDVINLQRYSRIAAGALVGYNFGPATLNFWLTDDFSSIASGKTPTGGVDLATVVHGYSAFASISYRLWAPEETAPAKRPQFTR